MRTHFNWLLFLLNWPDKCFIYVENKMLEYIENELQLILRGV